MITANLQEDEIWMLIDELVGKQGEAASKEDYEDAAEYKLRVNYLRSLVQLNKPIKPIKQVER